MYLFLKIKKKHFSLKITTILFHFYLFFKKLSNQYISKILLFYKKYIYISFYFIQTYS